MLGALGFRKEASLYVQGIYKLGMSKGMDGLARDGLARNGLARHVGTGTKDELR